MMHSINIFSWKISLMHPSTFFSMELSNLVLCCILLSTSGLIESVQGLSHNHHHHRGKEGTKLFVFGDSYADTGNLVKALASSWSKPYGMTFPKRPAGRFSDGRILTDYVARLLGVRSPIPYRWMKLAGEKIKTGMNFAYAGSGVFDTHGDFLPNLTTQISYFQNLMNQSIYTKQDLESSIALISLAGNDYAYYLANGGTVQGIRKLIPRVVNQLVKNLEHIHALGSKKIVVTGLQPLGCLPERTISDSFQRCNETQNALVEYHNQLLHHHIARLNNRTTTLKIHLLNLYNSFSTMLNQTRESQGLRFEAPLMPCCKGISKDHRCGDVDVDGTLQYTVCSNPRSAFFWDAVHPTQAGWHAVFMHLKQSLQHQLF